MSDEEAPNSKNAEFSTDSEHNLTCCIFMLDILLKQLELQDVEQHMGIHTQVCENVSRLMKCMVTAARVGVGSHICAIKVKQVTECAYCEASVMWHQLSTKLVQFMAPENPIRPPDVSISILIFCSTSGYRLIRNDEISLHTVTHKTVDRRRETSAKKSTRFR